MKVTLVCRMNQARSPFAHALLAHHYPEHQFFSTGTQALNGSPMLADVAAVAASWGLPIAKDHSSNLSADWDEIITSDLIVCAEPYMQDEIQERGFLGNLTNFEKEILDPSFMAIDPEGFPRDKIKQELAKVSYACIRAMERELSLHNHHKVLAVIPKSDSDSELAFAHALLEQKIQGSFLIDADFRAPVASLYSDKSTLVQFNPLDVNLDIFSSASDSAIFTPSGELESPEMILLSSHWRNAIRELSQIKPVILLTAPRYIKPARLPDSYLAAIAADEISTIAS